MPERNPAALLARKSQALGRPTGDPGPERCVAATAPEFGADPGAPADGDGIETNAPARDHRAMESSSAQRPRRRRAEVAATRHKAVAASDNPMHTVAHIAQRDGVSTRHIRRQIKSKKLMVHRFGRAIRISESDYQDYLRRCRQKR
jgi:excisionase family DNA binding protein